MIIYNVDHSYLELSVKLSPSCITTLIIILQKRRHWQNFLKMILKNGI